MSRRAARFLLFASLLASFAFVACNINDEDEDIPPTDPGGADDDDDDEDCTDADNDGWCVPDDCSDQNPLVHPGRIEDCDDGFDNDCNGLTDGEDAVCAGDDDGADDDADDDTGDGAA